MLLFFMGLQGPLWHTIPGDDRIETCLNTFILERLSMYF